MVHWGNEFRRDSGKRRKPPSRAPRPLNKPTSEANNTLVQTDRGVFVCSSAFIQIVPPFAIMGRFAASSCVVDVYEVAIR